MKPMYDSGLKSSMKCTTIHFETLVLPRASKDLLVTVTAEPLTQWKERVKLGLHIVGFVFGFSTIKTCLLPYGRKTTSHIVISLRPWKYIFPARASALVLQVCYFSTFSQ